MANAELKKMMNRARGMSEADSVADSMKMEKGEKTKMVDMKISKAEKKRSQNDIMPASLSSGERYPYGLQIRLDNDSMKKLGIELPEVGEEVTVYAKADITEASANETSEGGKRLSCTLQITRLQIKG